MPGQRRDESVPLLKGEVKANEARRRRSSSWLDAIINRLKFVFSGKGIVVDKALLERNCDSAVDIFKGVLVVLMVFSHTIISMAERTPARKKWPVAAFVNNLASVLCFTSFMIAFGYSSYRSYLKPLGEGAPRHRRVLRACMFPVIGAWILSFVWATVCFKLPISRWFLLQIFTFYKLYGNGPDFLLSFSINLALTYAAWRPLLSVSHGLGYVPQKLMIAAVVLAPLSLTFCIVPDCSEAFRYLNFLVPCRIHGEVFENVNLPALPHLFDFGLGICIAMTRDLFLADLLPQETLSVLPWTASIKWLAAVMTVALSTFALFLPLKEIWWMQLATVRAHTPFGWITRGFVEGPSALWLLATLWPSLVCACLALLLTRARSVCPEGTCTFTFFKWLAVILEHLGANVLFYLITTDIFLAGLSGTNQYWSKTLHYPLTTLDMALSTSGILLMSFFLHYLGSSGRK